MKLKKGNYVTISSLHYTMWRVRKVFTTMTGTDDELIHAVTFYHPFLKKEMTMDFRKNSLSELTVEPWWRAQLYYLRRRWWKLTGQLHYCDTK